MRRSSSFLLAILLTASSAWAHDQWLEVEPFRLAAPAPAKIYLLVGEHFEQAEAVRPRRRARYSRFELRSGTGSSTVLDRLREDDQPIATLDAPTAGAYLVALDSGPREIELTAVKFQDYVSEEGFTDILALRRKSHASDTPGEERYSRCLKTLFQRGVDMSAHSL